MKFLTIIFLLAFAVLSASAQDTTIVDSLKFKKFSLENLERRASENFAAQTVRDAEYYIEEYVFSGISVMLEGNSRTIARAWKDYLKKNNDVSLKKQTLKSLFSRKKTVYLKAKQVQLTNITNKYGDVLTVLQKENGMTKITFIFKLGYNVAVNSEKYGEEYEKMKQYLEHFAQLHFQKNYQSYMKALKKSTKVVKKEICKESKILRKMEKQYKRKYTKKSKTDDFMQLTIDVQRKLTETLQLEKNGYQYLMLQYKTRNSDIRSQNIRH
jgi:hypothetical protein